jgi:hypothetical protein
VGLLLEHLVGQGEVGFDAVVDGHSQAAEHDGDKAAGAGAADHVEVVSGVVGVDGVHEAAQDHEGGAAADAAAVEGEQADVVGGHGRGRG